MRIVLMAMCIVIVGCKTTRTAVEVAATTDAQVERITDVVTTTIDSSKAVITTTTTEYHRPLKGDTVQAVKSVTVQRIELDKDVRVEVDERERETVDINATENIKREAEDRRGEGMKWAACCVLAVLAVVLAMDVRKAIL